MSLRFCCSKTARLALGTLVVVAWAITSPCAPQTVGDSPKRQQTPTGKLLNRLDELRPKLGEDEWAEVLRDLIKLGPDALPELITEMDTTKDGDYMLRCMGFVVRGI